MWVKKLNRIFGLLLVTLTLSACGHQSALILQEAESIEDESRFRLFINRVPDCDFGTIAHLHSRGDYSSGDDLIEDFREEALELGANALSVEFIQRTDLNQYIGNARALRCM
jgi:hypothetical protein